MGGINSGVGREREALLILQVGNKTQRLRHGIVSERDILYTEIRKKNTIFTALELRVSSGSPHS